MKYVISIVLITIGTLATFFYLHGCNLTPSNDECHKRLDCLGCTESFCSWCGPRPGISGQRVGQACYSSTSQPASCDPPVHYSFCYSDPTTPINNRVYLRRPDGGAPGDR